MQNLHCLSLFWWMSPLLWQKEKNISRTFVLSVCGLVRDRNSPVCRFEPTLLGILSKNETVLMFVSLSCFTRQQPACVWWHWDSIRWKQRQRRPCLQCSVQTMEAAQLQREETKQDLWTGNSVCFLYLSIYLSSFKCCSVSPFIHNSLITVYSCVFHQQTSLSILHFQAMVIINGYLYVFGGTTGYLYSTDLHRLDLTTREWTHLKPNNTPSDLPEERSDVVAVTAECVTSPKYLFK